MRLHDVEAVADCCHDGIHLGLHLGDCPLAFAGQSVGRAAALERIGKMFDDWRVDVRDPRLLARVGQVARYRATLRVSHRWTGIGIELTARQVYEAEGGLIRRFDGYVDAPSFAAFLTMAGLVPSQRRTPDPLGRR